MNEAPQSPYLARFESFEVNLRSGELSKNGERIRLPEQSFQVLALLLERPGEVVTRQEIQQRLWPNDTVVEFEISINAVIRRLRTALGDSAEQPRYVETLARRGYRFKAPVVWTEPLPREAQATGPRVSPPIDLPAPLLIGKKVSHYRVLEILGGGGMGVVYKAEDLTLGRPVAMKFLPEELGEDAKARERFAREARSVSSLSHPNVCPIYELAEHQGQPFIVMELLQGKTLREHLAKGAFCLTDARGLDIAVQIASGLQAAHEKGIIHRDIKPANIFITEKNVAKILDFGVARVLETGEAGELAAAASREGTSSQPAAGNLTREGLKPGTAGYMSPEQIRGEPLDAGTDIFSFGAVLYEMATGERAFTGETERFQQEAALTENPRPVRELAPAISPKLEAVITRCLEKARDERYRSASELHQALVEVESRESAPRHEEHRSEATRPWVFSLLVAIALALGISGSVLYWRSHRAIKLTVDRTDKTNLEVTGRKAAEPGDARAMTKLGVMYENGRGVPRNDAQAASWYRKAANAGDARGMSSLGFLYMNGRGVPRNDAQAVSWSRKAADAGDARGMSNLGVLYMNGQGVPRDYARAVNWYRKAADAGYAPAMTNLGDMYASGRGVPRDDVQAASWYRKAAAWYRQAAEAGDAHAMTNLGDMYGNGRGVPRDDAQAANWYRKAAEAGFAGARESLKRRGQ